MSVRCRRCGRDAEPPQSFPFVPEKVAAELRDKVCAECWGEWQGAEVMVINELRLNFMDPASQEILERQMREFLALDAPAAGE